jgi:D-galactose 1-dehydrogenase
MAADIRIAIIGFGKIARDQHVPSITANPDFRLAAVATRSGAADAGVPVFTDYREMLDTLPLDAVAVCTPPGARHAIARHCLEAGLDVLLEKPPGATLGEVADLAALAGRDDRCLFTTWHAQFNRAVAQAADRISLEGLHSLRIDWLEDVEKWHPGQGWIWEPGGFGVFDAGINALSIATRLWKAPLMVRAAQLRMQAQGQQPIAASLELTSPGADGRLEAHFDWRHKGEERWTIAATTRAGTHLLLSEGGATLRLDGGTPIHGAGGEYAAIYRRFAALIAARQSHVDVEPLRLVADTLLLARRILPQNVARQE